MIYPTQNEIHEVYGLRWLSINPNDETQLSPYATRRMTWMVVLATLLGFLSSCEEGPKRPSDSPPNILFIMSDDHTSQSWGIYGGVLKDYVWNDNIQRLAQEGVVLNNAFCTNSICVPSRASIMTGQYSHENGVYTLVEGLHPDSMNIAKSLQKAGYATGLFGKWHLKEKPAGFDDFVVLPGQGRYQNPLLKTMDKWQKGAAGATEYAGYSADVITDLSLDWLKNRSDTKPFFLMTHFKATHEPFDYAERYQHLYEQDEIPEPPNLYDFGAATNGRSFSGQTMDILAQRWVNASTQANPGYPGLPFDISDLDSIEIRHKTYQKFIKDYMRCAAAIDDNIGRLLDYLDESGQAENTVVIYTADQGYFLGEHGFFDKRMFYEESLRMPFVIRYPREALAGNRIDDIILNIDFPALFADYAGIDRPSFVRGQSFRSLLKGKQISDWRQSMYYRYYAHTIRRPAHLAIRNHRYKLIFYYGHHLGLRGSQEKKIKEPTWEFYDLQTDPLEDHNAYNEEAYQEVILEMKKELKLLKKEVGDGDEQFPEMEKILKEAHLM